MTDQKMTSALNLWENETWKNLMNWMDQHIYEKTILALELPEEKRNEELNRLKYFKQFKKLIKNKVLNSL